jgi:predicted metal-dependent hydrolase
MDRRTTEGTLLVQLDGRAVEYRFARRRRRTLGITVDANGLHVAAPLRAPWREIEAFLRDKERWILRKLDEWARAPQAPVLRGASGESLPLFGAPVTLEVGNGRRAVHHEGERLLVRVPEASRVLKVLIGWLKQRALDALAPRVADYAARLGRPEPRVAISSARTQWGVCGEDGVIRLSWRLVHIEPALADYVVAHEVAHLVELNHSKRFWQLLAALYPDWREARERLEIIGASLPVMRMEASPP